MKPWNEERDSNRDAKSKDIQVRKRGYLCLSDSIGCTLAGSASGKPLCGPQRNVKMRLGWNRKRTPLHAKLLEHQSCVGSSLLPTSAPNTRINNSGIAQGVGIWCFNKKLSKSPSVKQHNPMWFGGTEACAWLSGETTNKSRPLSTNEGTARPNPSL